MGSESFQHFLGCSARWCCCLGFREELVSWSSADGPGRRINAYSINRISLRLKNNCVKERNAVFRGPRRAGWSASAAKPRSSPAKTAAQMGQSSSWSCWALSFIGANRTVSCALYNCTSSILNLLVLKEQGKADSMGMSGD